VKKLLAFSRRLPVTARAVAVEHAVNQLGALLKRVLGASIVFRTEVSPAVGNVHIDPGALDQILMNLALNARDAMPAGGSLVVEARRTTIDEAWSTKRSTSIQAGEYVVISVSDTGTGIEPALLERIFEPFFTTKGADRGTGLGLSTCWGLASQAGGTITVYSELGKGTTFNVYLPVSHAKSGSTPDAPLPAVKTIDATVLVVEDMADVRAVVTRILRRAGYKVLEAPNGSEALLLMEDVGTKVDMLLSDVVMPRMSGPDLARRLRDRFPHLKVLLMSGFPARAVETAEQHTFPMVTKPFTANELLDATRRVLEG
jgi:CheY-like chemotaxis protein